MYGSEVETLLAEIARFVTGEELAPAPSRALAAVLFTDLADSTERAAAVGDERWQRMLDVHDEVVRTAVRRHGGRVVKTTRRRCARGVPVGFRRALRRVADQCHARRPRPGCAHRRPRRRRRSSRRRRVWRRGSRRGSGDAAAEPLEVLVSDSARFAAAGEGFAFTHRGSHTLKGLPGEFRSSRARLQDRVLACRP